MLWDQSVELLRAVIVTVAQACNGNLGLGVLVVSLGLRLALLPLTLRLARRSLRHQRRMAELQPELLELQRRFAKDPAALWRATSALYQQHGVKPFDPAMLLGGLAQAPLFAALFAALRRGLGEGTRFLWIGNLARPDVTIALGVGALTIVAMSLAPTADAQRQAPMAAMVIAAGTTVWFLSSTSALFALSSVAGATVSVLQSRLLQRSERAQPA